MGTRVYCATALVDWAVRCRIHCCMMEYSACARCPDLLRLYDTYRRRVQVYRAQGALAPVQFISAEQRIHAPRTMEAVEMNAVSGFLVE